MPEAPLLPSWADLPSSARGQGASWWNGDEVKGAGCLGTVFKPMISWYSSSLLPRTNTKTEGEGPVHPEPEPLRRRGPGLPLPAVRVWSPALLGKLMFSISSNHAPCKEPSLLLRNFVLPMFFLLRYFFLFILKYIQEQAGSRPPEVPERARRLGRLLGLGAPSPFSHCCQAPPAPSLCSGMCWSPCGAWPETSLSF